MTTEAYLQDKGLTGKRKQAFDDDEVEEDAKEAEVTEEAEEALPAKDESSEASDNSKKKSKSAKKAPTKPGKDHDIDELATAVQSTLNLNNWFKIDRSQHFAIFACVFVAPDAHTHYVYVRVELSGSIDESMVKCEFINGGDTALITIKFLKGGELTNPEHCLTQYQHTPNIKLHPLYLNMLQIHRYSTEAQEEEEVKLKIALPFQCDPQGFFDPIKDDEGFLDLGIFPLEITDVNFIPDAPAPSTKFLHLICEELSKSKLSQRTRTKNYFPSPPMKVCFDAHTHRL